MNLPEINALYALLEIVGDPAAVRKRLDELAAATATANQATADAKAAMSELDQERAGHQGKLDAAREQHKTNLAQDRVELEAEFDDRRKNVGTREVALRAGEERLRTDRAKFSAESADARTSLHAAQAAFETHRAQLRR